MAVNQKPIFQDGPLNGLPKTFVNADGTTKKTVYTAGADGALVDTVAVVSDDTAAVILEIHINDGTTSFQVGELSIPAGSGTDGTSAAVNLLSTTALPWLQTSGGLPLQATYSLEVNAKAAVTATKTVTVTPFGGDF